MFDPRNSIYKRTHPITVDTPIAIPDAGPSVRCSPRPIRRAPRSAAPRSLGAPATEPIHLTIYDSAGRAIRALGPARPGA